MSDRELLELAARAAGYADAKWQEMEGWGEVRYGFSSAIWSEHLYKEDGSGYWNPLVDDGDAFRLAVKLDMFYCPELWEATRARYCAAADAGDHQDPCAATRRAITRAAAEIGKAMP